MYNTNNVLLILIFYLISLIRVSASNLEVQAEVGVVEYQENVSILPVQSDWDATFYALSLSLSTPIKEHWNLNLKTSFWTTESENENWEQSSVLIQRDQLSLSGAELLAELGYDFNLSPKIIVSPYLGASYRRQEFEREDFLLIQDEGFDPGRVNEDFDLTVIHTALELKHQVSNSVKVVARVLLGYVSFYEVANSTLGEIDGDGGVLFESQVMCMWNIGVDQVLGVGIHYDLQDLNGARKDIGILNDEGRLQVGEVELPDNELTRFSLVASWTLAL